MKSFVAAVSESMFQNQRCVLDVPVFLNRRALESLREPGWSIRLFTVGVPDYESGIASGDGLLFIRELRTEYFVLFIRELRAEYFGRYILWVTDWKFCAVYLGVCSLYYFCGEFESFSLGLNSVLNGSVLRPVVPETYYIDLQCPCYCIVNLRYVDVNRLISLAFGSVRSLFEPFDRLSAYSPRAFVVHTCLVNKTVHTAELMSQLSWSVQGSPMPTWSKLHPNGNSFMYDSDISRIIEELQTFSLGA